MLFTSKQAHAHARTRTRGTPSNLVDLERVGGKAVDDPPERLGVEEGNRCPNHRPEQVGMEQARGPERHVDR